MDKMPLAPPVAFQTALDVTAIVYQISADFMNTATQFQTAVRIKKQRVIRLEKKARGDVGGVETTLAFREEVDQRD